MSRHNEKLVLSPRYKAADFTSQDTFAMFDELNRGETMTTLLMFLAGWFALSVVVSGILIQVIRQREANDFHQTLSAQNSVYKKAK